MNLTVILFFLLLESASSDETCEDCKNFIGLMQDSYMTESFVQYQTTFLISSLCQDDMVCEDAVQTYWPGSAKALYPVYLDENRVCSNIGVCENTIFEDRIENLKNSEATCEDCVSWVEELSANMRKEDTIADVKAFLMGDGYCSSHENSVNKEDPLDCITFVQEFVDKIFETFADRLVESSLVVCTDFGDYCEL